MVIIDVIISIGNTNTNEYKTNYKIVRITMI